MPCFVLSDEAMADDPNARTTNQPRTTADPGRSQVSSACGDCTHDHETPSVTQYVFVEGGRRRNTPTRKKTEAGTPLVFTGDLVDGCL